MDFKFFHTLKRTRRSRTLFDTKKNRKFGQFISSFSFHFYRCESVSRVELYCGALGFLQSKIFGLFWVAVFFKICSHFFKPYHLDLSHTEVVRGAKKLVRSEACFFLKSTFKVE